MRKVTAWVAGAAIAITFGVVGSYVETLAQPKPARCPAEDSCTVDYRNGGWWIRDDSNGEWSRITR